jgi:hypothetical protein
LTRHNFFFSSFEERYGSIGLLTDNYGFCQFKYLLV